MAVEGWNYAEHVPDERRRALAAVGSFDAVVEQILSDVTNIRFRWEPGIAKELQHCVQPLFNLDLPKTGDAFFNGPHGYRAQYWTDPFAGLSANSRLLNALMPKLLAAVEEGQDTGGQKDIRASLGAISAKIWIRESTSLLDPTADLAVQRWVDHAKRGCDLARKGLMAPQITKFEVKGALLDPHGHEVVPAKKRQRHRQLHEYGYS